jgi:hypothetical protein
VWHDNHGLGPSWFLEHVTVFDQTTESKFEFPCDKWLSMSHDDKLLERVLPCAEYVMNGYVVEYDIEFKTAAGGTPCTAPPVVKLVGDDRESGEVELPLPPSGAFAPGEPVVYSRDLPALGNVIEASVRLRSSAGGDSPAQGWRLEYVKVTERRLGTAWLFPCDERIPFGGPFVSLRQSAVEGQGADATRGGEVVTYVVKTLTSDIKGAGTDAKVFVTIWGEVGGKEVCTGRRELQKSETHRDKFERGHEDVFKVEALDLGTLVRLKIEHDASGWKNSDWHLNSVRVADPRAPDSFDVVFPCDNWISKRKGAKQLWRELYPELAGGKAGAKS